MSDTDALIRELRNHGMDEGNYYRLDRSLFHRAADALAAKDARIAELQRSHELMARDHDAEEARITSILFDKINECAAKDEKIAFVEAMAKAAVAAKDAEIERLQNILESWREAESPFTREVRESAAYNAGRSEALEEAAKWLRKETAEMEIPDGVPPEEFVRLYFLETADEIAALSPTGGEG